MNFTEYERAMNKIMNRFCITHTGTKNDSIKLMVDIYSLLDRFVNSSSYLSDEMITNFKYYHFHKHPCWEFWRRFSGGRWYWLRMLPVKSYIDEFKDVPVDLYDLDYYRSIFRLSLNFFKKTYKYSLDHPLKPCPVVKRGSIKDWRTYD